MSKSALRIINDGRAAFSYATAIKDTLPDGRTLGNVTLYSPTTRKHQGKVNVYRCDILLDSVPQGTSDLRQWFATQWNANQLHRVELGGIRRHKIMTDGLIVYTRFPSHMDTPCVTNECDAP